VEYAMRKGLALRAEGIFFDLDVNYLQLGALYRFGRQPRHSQELYVDSSNWPVTVAATPKATQAPPIAAARAVDTDSDGVTDTTDACLDTRKNAAVDERGCALLSGVIEGVVFHSASAELTDGAKESLDEVALSLKSFPSMNFRIASYTDSSGSATSNLKLSQARGLSVARYLAASGIAPARFAIQAWGEKNPIADNGTPAGRARNRRVELIVIR